MAQNTPSPEMYDLLFQAAEMRAAGKTWDAIGRELGRSGDTCKNWPTRYRRHWLRIVAAVDSHAMVEAGAEARAVLRNFLRAEDDATRMNAAKLLLAARPKPRPRPRKPAAAREDAAHVELRRLSDAEVDQHIREFIADQQLASGPIHAASAAEPE